MNTDPDKKSQQEFSESDPTTHYVIGSSYRKVNKFSSFAPQITHDIELSNKFHLFANKLSGRSLIPS